MDSFLSSLPCFSSTAYLLLGSIASMSTRFELFLKFVTNSLSLSPFFDFKVLSMSKRTEVHTYNFLRRQRYLQFSAQLLIKSILFLKSKRYNLRKIDGTILQGFEPST
uniref:Uncharacterized protein n=1 Tax=Cacopsylla melanoneura TaxID=428564 RepID=A0A8D8QEZ7_9HEMI